MIDQDRFSPCTGSYAIGVRVNPTTGSAECPQCGRRFDRPDLSGSIVKRYLPLHSPCQLACIAAEEARRRAS